ncbi:MAG: A/G-specific adenine glycosylase [Chitinophagales bacterium]
MSKKTFNRLLNAWYLEHGRSLPWVGEKDAYLVWLSEIILQQTRVEHGIKYFEQFKKKFPTVKKLATAEEDTILKMWEGLGYYSRARNLHSAAKTIVKEYNGKFPSCYEDILKLRGIGSYTAAAIASFVFDLPYAVVDANVIRILARVFGLSEPVNSGVAKKRFATLAQSLLDKRNPAKHNQAMMDFGATICKPVSPSCEICPIKNHCYAFINNVVEFLPVRPKKRKKKNRFFHYLIITNDKKIFLQKRTSNDIWKNMYEFPLIEAEKKLTWKQLLQTPQLNDYFNGYTKTPARISRLLTQQLTHQTISARFFVIQLPPSKFTKPPGWLAVERKNLKDYAFPGIVREYLQEVL